MINLSGKRILVTGGDGFLGHHLVPLLQEKTNNVFVAKHAEFDLLQLQSTVEMYQRYMPDVVIHLAARVGGIQYNQKNPGKLFYENLQMGMNCIHAGSRFNLEKFVCIGTICSYPRVPKTIPFIEDEIWDGFPEDTNAPYGISKRVLLTMCQSYRKQYGMNCIFLMPVNLYGMFDTFTDEQGHVIPMLIKRFVEAKEDNLSEVIVWGSGNATREFMYAGDAAKAIVLATEKYDKSEPMNIGSGYEIYITDLAKLIARIIGYNGEIKLNNQMPDGQPRRLLNISRMRRELDFGNNLTPLTDGLIRTIEWYKGAKQL